MTRQDLYFIRHGQTKHNIDPLYASQNQHEDPPLTSLGEKQIAHMAPRIAKLAPQTHWISPLLRTRQSAGLILQVADTQISQVADTHILDDLRECDFPTWHELVAAKSLGDLTSRGLGFCQQVARALDQISRHPSFSHLVVAHGGVYLAMALLWNLPLKSVGNGELVWIHRREGRAWTYSRSYRVKI